MKKILLIIFTALFISGCSSQGVPVKVFDGDTFVLSSGDVIRLNGIDCPEKNQPFGLQAKYFTEQYLKSQFTYKVVSYDRYKRIIADIYFNNGTTLSMLLVQNGLAWAYKKHTSAKLYDAMWKARKNKVGMWSSYQEPPFIYRKNNRK